MGRRIGRYEIIAEIGRGGFGHVYRGLDPTVGRPVAIKVLTAAGEEGMLTRFRGEATASGRLRHPNIITVYDFGEQDGVPFIVMELLDGQDLQHVIESRKLPSMLQQVRIMSQIAAGLQHAHAAGIIHRDVKPANVMVLADGNVKLMDFGIALITQSTHSRLTPRGAMIGTFRYMAPEQFRGVEPDVRSDIFAYGLIFYELLSGIHPFHATDAAAQMFNILSVDPVPIGEICPKCPAELQAVVARLLQKDPEHRYQTLDDVLFDIEPSLIRLRAARARELFEEASSAKARNQLEAAQSLIRQVLELAPGYEGARELREQIQVEVRRQSVRPKVEDLLRKGREALATGNAAEAIDNFESAIRLDPVAAEIKVLLKEARSNAEKLREAGRLSEEAEAALREGDPSSASRLAQQALEFAPLETRAGRILAEAGAVLAREQERARLAEALGRIRRLIHIRSWEEAWSVLSQINGEFPGTADVRALAEEVRAGQEKDQRERSLAAGLAAARQEIQQADFPNALARLKALVEQYPDSSEAGDMLGFIRTEIEAKAHRLFVDGGLEEARAAFASRDFNRAVKILENALLRYPADQDLQRERRRMVAEHRETARREAAERAVAAAMQMRSQGQWPEAIESLDAFLRAHGADSAVVDLREGILKDQEAARRKEELHDFIRRANQLLERREFAETVTLLLAPPAHLKDDPQVAQLLGAAKVQRDQEIERKAALDKALIETRQFCEKGLFEQAFSMLRSLRERYGQDPQVASIEEQVQSAERSAQRALDDLIANATALLSANPAGATQLLGAAPLRFRERSEIQRLEQAAARASEDRRAHDAATSLVARARDLCSQERFEEALAVLDSGLAQFPEQPALLAAHKETLAAREQQELDVQAALARAQTFLQERPAEAVSALEQLKKRHDRTDVNAALVEARARVKALDEQAARERQEREVQAALARAQTFLQERPAEAVTELEQLKKRHDRPDVNAALVEARARVKALDEQAARDRQEREVHAALARAQALLQERPAEAVSGLEQLKKRHDRPDVNAALAQARDRVEALKEQGDQERASGALQSAAAAHDPKEALRTLQALSPSLRTRPEILEAIAQFQASVTAAERQEALAEIESFIATRKLTKALSVHAKAVQRFGSDQTLEELLTRIQAPPETPRPPKPPVAARKPVWMVAAAGSLALLAGGAWYLTHRNPAPTAVLVPVEIRTDPQGALIQLSDHSCVTPNCQLRLAPGQYSVEARLNGYDNAQKTITVEATQALAAVDLTLRPTAPPPPVPGRATGTLVVESGTPDALVFVDNAPVGRTDGKGRLTSLLAAAAHQVRVEKLGFETPRTRQVTIAANRSQSITFSLSPQSAKLEPHPAPAGVEPPPAAVPVPAPPSPTTPPDPSLQAWELVRESSDPGEIQNFIDKYSSSPRAGDARARLREIQTSRQEAAIAELDKRKREAEAQLAQEQDKQNQAKKALDEENARIRGVLDRLNIAFGRQKPAEIKAIWLNPPKSFMDAATTPRSLMRLTALQAATITSNQANVLCSLTSPQSPRPQQVRVTLQKTGADWMVLSIVDANR